jgi:ABC-2 type transport system ATP-binding protein
VAKHVSTTSFREEGGAVRVIVSGTHVAKSWGERPVFGDSTFIIEPGVTGLLGANGAGKTTLFGMLLGLHAPTAGSLRVLDLDPIASGPIVRQRLGYSPEHEALPADMTAYDFVRHVAELHGLPRRAAAGRASDALYEVGLGEERARPCGTMSTGQKQRVKLAQAIAHDPKLVLLDEPTNGLDPIQRDDMLQLIYRCGHDLGLSVIVSSHLLDEIQRTCDRVVIIANGVISEGGEIAETNRQQVGPLLVELATSEAGSEGFVRSLQQRGVDVIYNPANASAIHTVLTLDPDSHPHVHDMVMATAAELGMGIRSMKRQTRTLEDVFFEATA